MAHPAIYLDSNATTAVSDAAREAMLPFLGPAGGNPSSIHGAGRCAREAVDRARGRVADLVAANPSEVVFTSGGTEADGLAILGALEAAEGRRRVVASAVEHPAVRELLRWLRGKGRADLVEVPPDRDGTLDPARVLAEVRDDTALVSVMWANNETGMLHPVQALARGCRDRGVPFHTDAVQAAGKVPVDMGAVFADLLSISAHKFHGPKGAGALIVRRGARWAAPAPAGPQEGGRRGGTENVPGIAGMGAAAEEARKALGGASAIAALRDRLEGTVLAGVPWAKRATAPTPRTPNTSCLLFPGVEGEMLVLRLDARGISASSGSACSEGSAKSSPVLRAQGIPEKDARGALRVSLCRFTTPEEVDAAAAAIVEEAKAIRPGR